MTDDLQYLNSEYKKLLDTEEFGKVAEHAKEVIDRFCDSTISVCKDRFANLSTNNLQKVDENEIFVLQLNICLADKLKRFVETSIFNGQQACEKLKEYR